MKVCRESGNPACFGIIFALFTGVRIGELLGLRWNSVDFANHNFSVKVSLNRLKTFDENSPTATTLEPRTPKTKNSKRNIDIIDELYVDLVEHKRQQDEITAEFPGYNPQSYVFVTAEGNRFDPRTFQDLFHREVKAAEIKNANFHCLRHTFATRSIENGMDILVLSKVLGHAKPSTTLNMYGHVLTEHKKDSMQKISSLYSTPISTVKQQEQDKGLVLSL
ncbi:tyrosine-type recombinase/integrase [Caproiciproducens sp. CPB-2]|uniref:tyrosine-type recombinase/integrase n=1 Tax=Caproiciproducens sp. CPB-2 TaxID=3030017 RepID=UPI0023DA85D6|nr:site-specific integrase [Caproiciproducens sp. CPB-2]